jgi:hypothetical protein
MAIERVTVDLRPAPRAHLSIAMRELHVRVQADGQKYEITLYLSHDDFVSEFDYLMDKAKDSVGKNIKELMHAYKEKGKIGTSRPKSKGKALQQAKAVAMKAAGKSKGKKK